MSATCTLFQCSATQAALHSFPWAVPVSPAGTRPLQNEQTQSTLNISSADIHNLVPEGKKRENLEYLEYMHFW